MHLSISSPLVAYAQNRLLENDYVENIRYYLLSNDNSVHSLLLLKTLANRLLHDLNFNLVLAFLAAAFILYASYTSVCSPTIQPKPFAPALNSLSKVIIPTCSIWPQFYLDLVHAADEDCYNSRINIPLSTLMRDIKQGRIELRNPSAHLHLLIQGRLVVNGWHFRLSVSLKERIKGVKWYARDEFKMFRDDDHPEPVLLSDKGEERAFERKVMQLYYEQYTGHANAHPKRTIYAWPDLDSASQACLKPFIQYTQRILREKHAKLSILTFSTSKLVSTPFDMHFTLNAQLFSQPLKRNAGTTAREHLTSPAPFFARLVDVLKRVTSGSHALRVCAVSDISNAYAAHLERYAEKLEYEEYERRRVVKALGVQGWREERLCARWEAALYRGGMLARWIVFLEE